MRFRTKTILGVATIELALLVVLIASLTSLLRNSNQAELERTARVAGDLLAASAKDAVISYDLGTVSTLAKELQGSGQFSYVQVLDASGRVLAEEGDPRLLARDFKRDDSVAEVRDGILDWSSSILAGGERFGEVRLGKSIRDLEDLVAVAWRWAIGLALIELTLVAFFSWGLGTYLTRQLQGLRQANEQIAEGNLGYRIKVRGNDELAETAYSFNLMSDRITSSLEQLRVEAEMRREANLRLDLALVEVRERSQELALIFDLSSEGYISIHRDSGVGAANPAFLSLFDLSLEQALNLDETGVLHLLNQRCTPVSVISEREGISQVSLPIQEMESASGLRVEIGSSIWQVVDIFCRKSDMEALTTVYYFRDVTRDYRLEQSKSEFLMTAGHELRTPLSSIYGFAELLVVQDQPKATTQEFAGIILKQAGIMSHIVDELLELTSIEQGAAAGFVFETTSLGELIYDWSRNILPPDGREAPLVDIQSDAMVLVDKMKLLSAVQHVVSNAYVYSKSGTMVEISVIQEPGNLGRVAVRVTDHGIGMTAAHATRMFERFFKVDKSGAVPGVGLGASIARAITKLHGGDITVESEYGVGTQVSLWLPTDIGRLELTGPKYAQPLNVRMAGVQSQ